MKLSDYVINYLAEAGSRHAFGMSGGAAVHLFDSAARHPLMGLTCVAHEQSAAMAADGYARVLGKPGVCIVTSGPGATNLLTGACCSYYDSIPMVMLTGQVATHRLKGERPVRQVGFQETDVLSIYGSVTKFAHQVLDPRTIRWALDRAYAESLDGRPAPVLLDLPDDLQRAEVEHADMPGFTAAPAPSSGEFPDQVRGLLSLISRARRPVLVLGGGISSALVGLARQLVGALEIPYLQTWAGLHVMPYDTPHRLGTFGVYGNRRGNFAIQNADLIVALGTRLSQNLTGGLLGSFAPSARLAMVDVDQGEMDKFDGRGITVTDRIACRLERFFPEALAALTSYHPPEISDWLATIGHWSRHLPDDRPIPPTDSAGFIDAHHLVDELSAHFSDDELIFADTGGNLTWTCNNIRLKGGQRLFSAWNFTPMGYALAASLGGAAAASGRPLTCIIGDGGLQLCLGELATIIRYNIPVKIILFNNHGHGIQKQTLDTWLDGHHVGVDGPSGLGFANFPAVAQAHGLPVVSISRTSEVREKLMQVYCTAGPVLCNVEIRPDQKLYPVVKFGQTLDNQMPLLPPDLRQSLKLAAGL
jgi:acetolactate synthase-1/2/3 large subunit